jgi:hypothetical protein
MDPMGQRSLDQKELEVNPEMPKVDLLEEHLQFLLVEHPVAAEVYSVH